AFLLGVPRRRAKIGPKGDMGSIDDQGVPHAANMHYIVAYRLAPRANDAAHLTARDILILDPGGAPGRSYYKHKLAVTLDDYFCSIDTQPGAQLSYPSTPADSVVRQSYIEAWFNTATYHIKSPPAVASLPAQGDKSRLVRRISDDCKRSPCFF